MLSRIMAKEKRCPSSLWLIKCRAEDCPKWHDSMPPVEPICRGGHWNCDDYMKLQGDHERTLLCSKCEKRLGYCG